MRKTENEESTCYHDIREGVPSAESVPYTDRMEVHSGVDGASGPLS